MKVGILMGRNGEINNNKSQIIISGGQRVKSERDAISDLGNATAEGTGKY